MTDTVKVLAVVPGAGQGSSMIFARRQIKELQALGVNVRAFFLSTRTAPLMLIREYLRFRREVREFSPDVIHAHFGTVTSVFAGCGSLRPLVITYRGSDLNPCPSGSRVRGAAARLLSQAAALRASKIICVSSELRDRLWFRKSHAVVLPSGVDTTVFYPMPRDAARSRLGWSEEDRIVLFNAGREPEVKRLDLAQAAVDEAKRRMDNVRLVVLDGSVDPAAVSIYMNAADCLLVTSDWEGSPCIVQEANACNLPVVSLRVGDVPQLLEGVTPSYIVDRDPAAIAAALTSILQSPARSTGSAHLSRFALSNIAQKTARIYQGMLRACAR